MIFSKEDKKRIGRNISAIREAYGFTSAIDFAIALNPKGEWRISDSMIQKIEAGSYELREGNIRTIGALTGFSYSEIVFEDLTDLKKNSLQFNLEMGLRELIEDEDFMEYGFSRFRSIYPFITSDEAEQSEDFKQAYKICIEKIDKFDFEENDVVHVINGFYRAEKDEGYVNILSALGRLYSAYVTNFLVNEKFVDKVLNNQDVSLIDLMANLQKYKGYDEDDFLKRKVYYLERYNKILITYMRKVMNSIEYKDFAYYFLALRYYYGIMDNRITKISDEDMNVFGKSMMDSLVEMQNKYALEFSDYIDL